MQIQNNTDRKEVIRGVKFPPGEAVEVKDKDLQRKMLAIPGFAEVTDATNKA